MVSTKRARLDIISTPHNSSVVSTSRFPFLAQTLVAQLPFKSRSCAGTSIWRSKLPLLRCPRSSTALS